MRTHGRKSSTGGQVSCLPGCILAILVARTALAHPGLHHDIARVTEALLTQPDRVDLLVRRGHLYRLEGNLLASLADLNRAQKVSDANPWGALQRGLTLSALRRDVEAEAELTRCLRHEDKAVIAYAERARVRERRGRHEDAIADFTAALQIEPNIDLYLARGRIQEILGRRNEAANGYRDGLRRLNGAVLLRLALIRVQVEQRRYDQALTLIQPVLNRVPVKTDWYRRRAEVLTAAGRRNEAKNDFRLALAEADQALERRPTSLNLVSRAKVYAAMGRTDDALADLRKAIEKSPRFPDASRLLEKLQPQPEQHKKSEP